MKDLKETIKNIYQEDKKLLLLMIATLILSVFLFLYTILTLDPSGSVVKIGYDDVVRGYRNGAWTGMLVYPLAAVLFGILHNLIAVRLFERKNAGTAKVFLGMTIALMVGMFIMMLRLLGKG